MKTLIFSLMFLSLNLYGQEVIKYEYDQGFIDLKIIQVDTDSYETYTLTNNHYREMQLVCANNRVYDDNPKAMIKLKNFYNEWAFDFIIENNQVCLDMGKFIEQARNAVDEKRPFLIRLDRKNGTVARIEYPEIDPLSLTGDIADLLPKKRELPTQLDMSDIEVKLD